MEQNSFLEFNTIFDFINYVSHNVFYQQVMSRLILIQHFLSRRE